MTHNLNYPAVYDYFLLLNTMSMMEGNCLCGQIKVTISTGLKVAICRMSPFPPKYSPS